MESRYSVRQTADITGVKPYVLRYWEEELGIDIQRNEMGHRYYTGNDIQLILKIEELKKKGFQLRAIKEMLPEILEQIQRNEIFGRKTALIKEKECDKDDSYGNTAKNSETRENEDNNIISKKEEQGKILEFQSILERLILRELGARDEEEERCRSLDIAIRRQQLVRKEAAVSGEKRNGRKSRTT